MTECHYTKKIAKKYRFRDVKNNQNWENQKKRGKK